MTPDAPTVKSKPLLFPSRQPLTSTGGPTAQVLSLVLGTCKSLGGGGGVPADFASLLPAAMTEPTAVSAAAATTLATGFSALLARWPPPDQKQFALLYLARLLAASSESAAGALVDAAVPATLLHRGGLLDASPASAPPLPGARGARLMGLALLANVASRAAGAAQLLELRTNGGDGGAEAAGCADEGVAVVHAAAAALAEASDAAVSGMGGALAHNLALAMRPERAANLAPPLLAAALKVLEEGSDAVATARALSVVGHLIAPVSDVTVASDAAAATVSEDVVAIALSLDASACLSRLEPRASALGVAALLREVRALLS